LGWEKVGDPTSKNLYTNGADLVLRQGADVLAVELKDTISVNLGTLGKNIAGNYGGSIARVLASATRFGNSTISQLQEESQAILKAAESGNLQNALFTSAQNVSQRAQDEFNAVYNSAKDGTANALKPLSTAAAGAVESGLQAAATFLSNSETMIVPFFFYHVPPELKRGGVPE
jgi:hypothetical protein